MCYCCCSCATASCAAVVHVLLLLFMCYCFMCYCFMCYCCCSCTTASCATAAGASAREVTLEGPQCCQSPSTTASLAHQAELLAEVGSSSLTEYKLARWGQEEDPLPGLPSRVDSALARKLNLPFDVDVSALVASYKSSAAAAAGRVEDEEGAYTPKLSLFLATFLPLTVCVAHCL